MDSKNYTEISSFKSKDWFLIFLFILIIFHVAANLIWIRLNNVPPTFDSAFHTTLSMKFYDHIKTNISNLGYMFVISKYYPPLVHLIGTVLTFFAGFNHKTIQLTSTIFFVLAIEFVYVYVSDEFKNKRMAFFSAFFFSFFLTVYDESRKFLLDVPLTALLLATIICLRRSGHFQHTKYTLLFFLSFALAMMIKWVAIIFLFIPLAFEVQTLLEKKMLAKIFNRIFFNNLIIGFFIVLIICVPWYLTNLKTIIEYGSYYSEGTSYSPQNLFSLENFFFYANLIVGFVLTFPGAIFFLLSVWLIIQNRALKQFALIFSMILVYYLFFTFLTNKAIRYVIPLTPFLAMVMGYGLDKLLDKDSQYSLTHLYSYFVLVFLVLSFFILSFGIPLYPQYKYAYRFPLFGWLDIYYWDSDPVKAVYNKEDWKNEEIAGMIFENLDNTKFQKLLVINDLAYLGPSTVNISIFEKYGGIPHMLQDLDTNFPAILNGEKIFPNEDNLRTYLNQADFVITTKDSIGPQEAMFDYDVRQQLQQYFILGSATNFQVIRKYPLPDGNIAYLYKRI